MTILKVTSDNGTIKTYIVLDNCFSIKSQKDESGDPLIVFTGTNGQTESFSFKSEKSRDAYLEALEQEDLIYDNLIIDDDYPEDEESEEEDNSKDYLSSSYDPMDSLRENKYE